MTPGDQFLTTRWTQVLVAQGSSTQAESALTALCSAYYEPVHIYVSRTARDLGDPRDLTQEFFARLLAGRGLGAVEREKGRFRSYLLGAVKHFLADARERQHALKRGAQHEHVPLAPHGETSPGLDTLVVETPAPDVLFDRQWGLAVLDLALTVLATEHQLQGNARHFELLKPSLTGELHGENRTAIATELGLTDGAAKVAIHRLRKRFRDLVKAEIAQTVSTDEEAREELRYLIEVVS